MVELVFYSMYYECASCEIVDVFPVESPISMTVYSLLYTLKFS